MAEVAASASPTAVATDATPAVSPRPKKSSRPKIPPPREFIPDPTPASRNRPLAYRRGRPRSSRSMCRPPTPRPAAGSNARSGQDRRSRRAPWRRPDTSCGTGPRDRDDALSSPASTQSPAEQPASAIESPAPFPAASALSALGPRARVRVAGPRRGQSPAPAPVSRRPPRWPPRPAESNRLLAAAPAGSAAPVTAPAPGRVAGSWKSAAAESAAPAARPRQPLSAAAPAPRRPNPRLSSAPAGAGRPAATGASRRRAAPPAAVSTARWTGRRSTSRSAARPASASPAGRGHVPSPRMTATRSPGASWPTSINACAAPIPATNPGGCPRRMPRSSPTTPGPGRSRSFRFDRLMDDDPPRPQPVLPQADQPRTRNGSTSRAAPE